MSLENMKLRLQYQGGNQQERMNKDKLKSLKKALIYSYQAATAKLSDGREFRCLINKNKLSLDLDDKIISIPFKDICLNADRVGTTTEGQIEIGLKEGDVFEWKENGSHWMVLLNKDEETAYCRAICRRCRTQVEINGTQYWVYVKGPAEESMSWSKGGNVYFNDLNYTLTMFITKDENTKEFFKRFQKVKVHGNNWEVQAIDAISSEGIIEVALKEDYNNTIEDTYPAPEAPEEVVPSRAYIKGPSQVKPFDIIEYTLEKTSVFGTWAISNDKAKIIGTDSKKITVEILASKPGKFSIVFRSNVSVLTKEVEIVSI
jgi:hypothetical protein